MKVFDLIYLVDRFVRFDCLVFLEFLEFLDLFDRFDCFVFLDFLDLLDLLDLLDRFAFFDRLAFLDLLDRFAFLVLFDFLDLLDLALGRAIWVYVFKIIAASTFWWDVPFFSASSAQSIAWLSELKPKSR